MFRNKLHLYLPDDNAGAEGANGGDGAANAGAGAPNAGAESNAGGSNTGGTGDGTPPVNQADPKDISALPENWQKHIRDLRGENGTRRQENATLVADRDKYKQFYDQVLGVVNPQDQKDPAQLAQEVQAERQRAQEADRKLAIYQLAGQHGADPSALLDSASFLESVRKIDPASSDFSTQMAEQIKGAVEKNGRLKARSSNGSTQQTPGSSGSTEFPGGAGGNQLTREDLKKMSPEQIEKARTEGRLKTLMGG